jgi:2-oxoglutarate dehydrogenase complex dehydrogenase (E1) component-like enzyme
MCSGKVHTDLIASEKHSARDDVAIVRLEQLYPVSVRELRDAFDSYPKADEIVWVQEEPENMGAWEFVRPLLEEAARDRRLAHVARPRSASPAEGSAARHAINQQALVDQAFGEPRSARPAGRVAEKARHDAALTSSKG